MGRRTEWEHDAYGRIVREKSPDGYEVRHEYNANHDLIQTIDNDGRETQYVYDNDHNLTLLKERISGGQWKETIKTYDAKGRCISEKDALGNETVKEYDDNRAYPRRVIFFCCFLPQPAGNPLPEQGEVMVIIINILRFAPIAVKGMHEVMACVIFMAHFVTVRGFLPDGPSISVMLPFRPASHAPSLGCLHAVAGIFKCFMRAIFISDSLDKEPVIVPINFRLARFTVINGIPTVRIVIGKSLVHTACESLPGYPALLVVFILDIAAAVLVSHRYDMPIVVILIMGDPLIRMHYIRKEIPRIAVARAAPNLVGYL